MGNASLREIAVISETPFEDITGSVIAIDAHNWLYRYLTTTVKWTKDEVYTTTDGTEVANLIGIVQGLPKFFEHDLTPVFVFDGEMTELKEDEIEERRQKRKEQEKRLEKAREEGDEIKISRLESRTQHLTDVIHETTRELFTILDVPYIEAPAEGEAQAAYMARVDSQIDYAGTEDYDALLLGAPKTLRKLTSKGHPEIMDFEATLKEHDISWEQLVDVGILCGTDYNDGLEGFGPKTALKEIKEHGDLWGVLDANDAYIEHADEIRRLFLDPTVTDDYEVQYGLDPDIDSAKEYVIKEWEIDADEVERGFERIQESVVQTGLDQWS